MKKIYLVQKMKRGLFKYYAHKGVTVDHLDCYGQVTTMWCNSKRKAIRDCRNNNRKQDYVVFFVRRILDYSV